MKTWVWRLMMAVLLLLIAAPHRSFAQDKGKIGDFEKEVDDKDRKDDDDDDDDDTWDDDDDGGFYAAIAGDGLWLLTRATFHTLFYFPREDSLLYRGSYRNVHFSDYPYAGAGAGLYSLSRGRQVAFNLAFNHFYHGENLRGVGFRGRFSPFPYISLEGQYLRLTEDLERGSDYLELYNAFVNYNRLRTEPVAIWWGLGLKGMRGSVSHTGPAFNLGSEIYFKRPLSFHLAYSVGSLNSTGVSELYLRLNLHVQRFTLFLGYQNVSAGSADLNGLISGIGVYL